MSEIARNVGFFLVGIGLGMELQWNRTNRPKWFEKIPVSLTIVTGGVISAAYAMYASRNDLTLHMNNLQ